MFKKIVLAAAAAAALLLSSLGWTKAVMESNPPVGQETHHQMLIMNGSPLVMLQFRIRPPGAQRWSDDLLGKDVLLPAQAVLFDIQTGQCMFDLVAKMSDSRVVFQGPVDVCEQQVLVIAPIPSQGGDATTNPGSESPGDATNPGGNSSDTPQTERHPSDI